MLAVLGGPTYEPATNTLDAALASGEIELVRSDELRAELANWRRLLSDTGEDEREVRKLHGEFSAADLQELLASLDRSPVLLRQRASR